MMISRRVYIGWNCLPVHEVSAVALCHKCCAHGHLARYCKETERLCRGCGEKGHLMIECKSSRTCRNCRLEGRRDDHPVNSNLCPQYGCALERLRTLRNVQYE